MPVDSAVVMRLLVISGLILRTSSAFVLAADGNLDGSWSLGTQYTYDYDSLIRLNEAYHHSHKGQDPLFSKFRSKIILEPVWRSLGNKHEILLRLQINDPKVNSTNHSNDLGLLSKFPFYVRLSNGRIQEIYFQESETQDPIKNLKKAVASLLQFQTGSWEGWEEDVSGQCYVSYDSDHHGIKKRKNHCLVHQHRSTFRQEKILDMDKKVKYDGLFVLNAHGTLEKAEVIESISISVLLRKEIGGIFYTRQKLAMIEQKDSELNLIKEGSEYQDVIREIETTQTRLIPSSVTGSSKQQPHLSSSFSAHKLNTLLNTKKRQMKSSALASRDSAEAFLEILEAFQNAPQAVITSILKDKKNKDILPQLMDILGTSGSFESYKSVIEAFGVGSTRFDLTERYLWALSGSSSILSSSEEDHLKLVTTPDREKIAEELFKVVKEGKFVKLKLHQSWLNTLSAIASTLEDPRNVIEWLRESLAKCKAEDCQLLYLRSLKNLRESSSSLTPEEEKINFGEIVDDLSSILTSEKSAKAVKLAVLNALKAFPSRYISERKISSILLSNFVNLDEDSSVRTLSSDILLLSPVPDAATVKTVIKTLSRQLNRTEFNTYVMNRLLEYSGRNPQLAVIVRDLKYYGDLNWNLLSVGGFSSSFSREISNGASFSFGMEIAGMVLKRSSLEVFIHSPKVPNAYQLLQLDIFAGGLSSFVAEKADPEDDPDANARMELTLMGNKLRPFIFFDSMGELMNLYWSGAAEQKTSALQGTQKLHDHKSVFYSSTGSAFTVSATSAISYDFSGQSKISLWSKTSDCLVETAVSLALHANFENQIPWSTSTTFQLSHTSSTELKLDLSTDLNFGGEDIDMCIKMKLPDFTIRHFITKKESDNKAQPPHKLITKVPGKTLFLNQKNCDLCNKMYPKA